MKKIVASVSLIALGAVGLQSAAQAEGLLGPDDSKPWSVALTLRGFYDDNVNSAPSNETETFGYEVSPSFKVGWTLPQSTFLAGYTYSFKYYEDKPPGNSDKDDQTHTFNIAFNHDFTDRTSIKVSDSFVIGQEPDLLRAGDTLATYQRVSGENIRNFGRVGLSHQWNSRLGTQLGYDNAYYNYDDNGTASLSSRLDRMEQSVPLELVYQLQPETRGIFGYRYRQFDYTADDWLDTAETFKSDVRDSRSHAIYVGADHDFRPDLTASLRAGAQVSDYYDMPNSDTHWSPYAQGTVRWTYAQESFLEGGLTYDISATDLIGIQGDTMTTDAEALVLYANWTHRIASKVYGSLLASFQNSTLQGGMYDSDTEQFYSAGVNIEYRFDKNISAHVGYNFDKLVSDIDRDFNRNRVYVGVTARY